MSQHGSPEVTAAAAAAATTIVTAVHGRAEFYSIGHRKIREAFTTTTTVLSVFAQLRAEASIGAFQFLPLTDAIIDCVQAVFTTARPTTYLRAADALHLAAPPLFGLVGVNVIP